MNAGRDPNAWLATIRAAMMRGDPAAAQASAAQALAEFPGSAELLRVQAGVFMRAGRDADAEPALRSLLAANPGDAASAFALAELLARGQRTAAAAATLTDCLLLHGGGARDPELAIRAIELLDGCGRKTEASQIAERAISQNPGDARLHAYAGMLAIQLGDFDLARQRYLFAVEHDPRALEWHIPTGLAATQRYDADTHPDIALFNEGLGRADLSDRARAELHFALGKAWDDLGDYARAAQHFEQGNRIRHQHSPWSAKTWRRMIAARLSGNPMGTQGEPMPGFTPVFIVGMPRTGTTLLAKLLSRRTGVCNRGELACLAQLAEEPALNGKPSKSSLREAAMRYARHAIRDDAGPAQWFVDKQPLNFRYIDLALALFPDAKIIRCTRSPRDTALSLWMQCFLEEVQGYSYDFAGIALVMRDEQRLAMHWNKLFPASTRTVHYEALVRSPSEVVGEIARWIGLPSDSGDKHEDAPDAISTASLWQARQPVNSRSVDRWVRYAPHIPGLASIPAT